MQIIHGENRSIHQHKSAFRIHVLVPADNASTTVKRFPIFSTPKIISDSYSRCSLKSSHAKHLSKWQNSRIFIVSNVFLYMHEKTKEKNSQNVTAFWIWITKLVVAFILILHTDNKIINLLFWYVQINVTRYRFGSMEESTQKRCKYLTLSAFSIIYFLYYIHVRCLWLDHDLWKYKPITSWVRLCFLFSVNYRQEERIRTLSQIPAIWCVVSWRSLQQVN